MIGLTVGRPIDRLVVEDHCRHFMVELPTSPRLRPASGLLSPVVGPSAPKGRPSFMQADRAEARLAGGSGSHPLWSTGREGFSSRPLNLGVQGPLGFGRGPLQGPPSPWLRRVPLSGSVTAIIAETVR